LAWQKLADGPPRPAPPLFEPPPGLVVWDAVVVGALEGLAPPEPLPLLPLLPLLPVEPLEPLEPAEATLEGEELVVLLEVVPVFVLFAVVPALLPPPVGTVNEYAGATA
jgi:hypothetical protein